MTDRLYTLLYAVDVPHYGAIEIEAASDAEALLKAIVGYSHEIPADPGWESAYNPRIVHLADPDDAIVAEDIALDDPRLPLQSLVATIESVIAQIAALRTTDDETEADRRLALLAADAAAIARWIEKARSK